MWRHVPTSHFRQKFRLLVQDHVDVAEDLPRHKTQQHGKVGQASVGDLTFEPRVRFLSHEDVNLTALFTLKMPNELTDNQWSFFQY